MEHLLYLIVESNVHLGPDAPENRVGWLNQFLLTIWRVLNCFGCLQAASFADANMLRGNKDNDGPDTRLPSPSRVQPCRMQVISIIASYTEQGVTFNNVYDVQGQYMSAGFAVSKLHDKVTAGFNNKFSVYGDGGAAGSTNFAVCYYADYTTITTGVNDAYFSFGAGV
ncbi:MAG: hypothetical protein ACLTZY_04830 [Alistipes indistinctus]